MDTITTQDVAAEICRKHGLKAGFDFLRRYPVAVPITVYRDDAEEMPPPDVSYELISNGYQTTGMISYEDTP